MKFIRVLKAKKIIKSSFVVYQYDSQEKLNCGWLDKYGKIDYLKVNAATFNSYDEAVTAAKKAYVPNIMDEKEFKEELGKEIQIKEIK